MRSWFCWVGYILQHFRGQTTTLLLDTFFPSKKETSNGGLSKLTWQNRSTKSLVRSCEKTTDFTLLSSFLDCHVHYPLLDFFCASILIIILSSCLSSLERGINGLSRFLSTLRKGERNAHRFIELDFLGRFLIPLMLWPLILWVFLMCPVVSMNENVVLCPLFLRHWLYWHLPSAC